jgi:pyruvate/2-oxoglutarate dehydrogenase complex dihydrolipoamide dehydrogenase (E3) component
MAIENYQNVIIGSGESGKFLAWNQSKLGEKTVIIERSMLGGSCPNVACLPSKNLIHSAKVASLVGRAAEFGISTSGATINMAAVTDRKRKMIDGLMDLHRTIFHGSAAELVWGEARFTEPRTVAVSLNAGGTRVLRGERVFIATGSRASLPDVAGLADAKPMTHVEALNLERLPENLIVLGGGYIGLEFAQAMRRFGSGVTIVQRSGQLLEREDADVAEALRQLMTDEGIEVHLKAQAVKFSGQSGRSVQMQMRVAGAEKSIEASDILVATGRTPNTDGLDLDKAGVQLDSRGYVRVDEKLQTTAPGVWAMGDCAGSPQFTHVGFDDFRIVRDNLAGKPRGTRDRLIPYCLFTDPELAHVGLSESEATAKGIHYRIAKLPMTLVLRTRTLSETRGFAKALVGDNDRILGFTAFGVEAAEMMSAVQTAMLGGMPYTALRDAIFTHPTSAEGLTSLFAGVPGLA